MKPTYDALKKLISASPEDVDLAEEFGGFTEDHLSHESEIEFISTVMALPEPMRRSYLALQADVIISGDGFCGYYEESRNEQFYKEVAEGFNLIGKPELADVFSRAIKFLRRATKAERNSIEAMDDATDNIHGEYFHAHGDLPSQVGAFVRRSEATLLG